MREKRGERTRRKKATLDEAIEALGNEPEQEDIVKFILRSGFKTAAGKFQHEFSPDMIQRLLRMLYSSAEPDKIRFYSQARDGLPIAEVETNVAGRTIHPTVALINSLDATPWHWTRRPESFPAEAEWPPTTVSDLMGCASLEDWCLECHSTIRPDILSNEYLEWRGKMFIFWLENLRLCRIRKYGSFGVRARNEIPKNTILGEYTGDLVPVRPKVSNEITQYHFDIDIGRDPNGHVDQADCWLDATNRGSILRFVNHSCDPNSKAKLGRCGIHNRVMFMVTDRDIEDNEEITIDYGEKWFATKDEPCLCGSSNCRNPKKEEGRKKEPTRNDKVSRGEKVPKKPEESSKTDEREAKEPDKQDKGIREDAETDMPALSTQTNHRDSKEPKKQDQDSKEGKEVRESDLPSKTRGEGSKQPEKQEERAGKAKEGKKPESSKTTKEKVAKVPQKQNVATKEKERVKGSRPSPKTGEEVSKKHGKQEEATQTGKKIGNAERLRMMKDNRVREPTHSPRPRQASPRLTAASPTSKAANEAIRKRTHAEDSDEEVQPPMKKAAQKKDVKIRSK